MAIEDISGFITEVAVHYAPPKYNTANERDAWLRSIHTALKGSAPAVLARAAQLIIDTRKNRYFPLVADLRQACRDAAEELRFDQHMETLPALRKELGSGYSKARVEFAETLLKSPLGREAARDGWVLACRDFAVREQRLPDSRRYEPRNRLEREEYVGCTEIEFCKRSARGFDEAYRTALRGEAIDADGVVKDMPNAKALQNLGSSMLAKREKLRDEVMGR